MRSPGEIPASAASLPPETAETKIPKAPISAPPRRPIPRGSPTWLHRITTLRRFCLFRPLRDSSRCRHTDASRKRLPEGMASPPRSISRWTIPLIATRISTAAAWLIPAVSAPAMQTNRSPRDRPPRSAGPPSTTADTKSPSPYSLPPRSDMPSPPPVDASRCSSTCSRTGTAAAAGAAAAATACPPGTAGVATTTVPARMIERCDGGTREVQSASITARFGSVSMIDRSACASRSGFFIAV
mmetsp:Transcript_17324/g.51221  ORF Transcript_17324/g.51221 Transcript_17324/m.51221 type:complete len:242 (-) Transcript_17324:193-918(-)